jgi:hypothetical protein
MSCGYSPNKEITKQIAPNIHTILQQSFTFDPTNQRTMCTEDEHITQEG